MTALVRKYGLFYLTHAGTFFFLCAYSLATSAPNYPFLPALFLPIYMSAALAISEREHVDPLLGMLPITQGEIMTVKFGLAFAFVVIGWLHMGLFTVLQGLDSELAGQVMKLNTLSCIFTLQLAAGFQLGLYFFGRSSFYKVIILFTVVSAVFSILFFIGLAENGYHEPGMFPLVPFLDSLPIFLLAVIVAAGTAVFYFVLRRGPWSPASAIESIRGANAR